MDKNQAKKAKMVESKYLLHIFEGQKDSSALIKISTTLAPEEAAANVRVDNTCFRFINRNSKPLLPVCDYEL